METKQILFKKEAREKIIAGVNKLANAVKITLGACGRNVAIANMFYPTVTKDGVTVAQFIQLQDSFENMGAQMIKEAASKTNDVCGDGTTTSVVLAQAMILEGTKMIVAGHNPTEIKGGMDIAGKEIIIELKKMSCALKEEKEIKQIATISANGDNEIGNIVTRAISEVGKEGVISIEEGIGSISTAFEIIEGMHFDKGYISPYFVTDTSTMKAVIQKPFILICNEVINNINTLLPVIGIAQKEQRPLVIVAKDVSKEVIGTLILNKNQGRLSSCVIKSPGRASNQQELLEDIAIVTEATLISSEKGTFLNKVTKEMLGSAGRIESTLNETIIIKGKGNLEDIKKRVASIKVKIKEEISEFNREKLQERLAKLVGGVGIINVGAVTEVEMKEKTHRVEDALSATKAAIAEGTIPGGGIALLKCSQNIKTDLKNSKEIGKEIVKKACEASLKQIAFNGGFNGEMVVSMVLKVKDKNYGFDVSKGDYTDLNTRGIIDPTKVVRCALQNAISVAGMILTTEAIICEDNKENK